jgi:hypothetical protein
VDFVTGSTRFGSIAANTHVFTGSVSMTGSLAVVTTGTELQVNASGVNIGNVIGDAHNITGSVGISGSATFASSVAVGTILSIGSFAGNSSLFQYTFSGANANSRTWRTAIDNVTYGDWTLQQATTQGGSTFANILRFSEIGAATFASSVTTNGTVQNNLTGGAVLTRDNGTAQIEVNIRHNSNRNGVVSFTENGVADRWAIGTKPSDGALYFSSNFDLSSPKVVVTSGGNFGIGVTNPTTAKLSIAIANSATNIGGIDITNGVNASFNVSLRTDTTEITAGGTGNMVFSNTSERMRITSGGSVLIGSTDAAYGTFVAASNNPSSYTIASIRNMAGGAAGGVQGSQLNFYGDVGYSSSIPTANIRVISNDGGSNGHGVMTFSTHNGSGSCLERMRITSGGNVLIGSSTSKADGAGKLQVTGGIHASTGYYTTGVSQAISALNTNYVIRAGAYSGLIVIRDNTNGGSGVWLADPNQGFIQIANNMPGTFVLSYNGNTVIQKTSGNAISIGVAFYSNEFWS